MSNSSSLNPCPPPFYSSAMFPEDGGFLEGRFCANYAIECCLPCPMTDWVYPDHFSTLTELANWVATASGILCVFLLLSWICLPVEKTSRHYLSVCLTVGVLLMNIGFILPLAAKPQQCFNEITPHSMHTSTICGASGAFLLLGGWAGVMWAFLRSLSLHLQICWQVLVGRNFMIFAQIAGWGIPAIGLALALYFSGVSFRFGATCHINHANSLADFWIPLLIFAGLTVVITFATFGYCIKVYLASLYNGAAASTEGSSNPGALSTTSHSRNPRQAYRRVRRVIAMQWRGIAIVLIICADVIFFSVVFVFLDNVIQSVTEDPKIAEEWIECLWKNLGDKNACLGEADEFVLNLPTVTAVLLLLGLNGVWLLFLMGRWSMVRGWIDLLPLPNRRGKQEFVSVDARYDNGKDTRAYEMLSKETSSAVVTPLSPVMQSPPTGGRQTPDYYGQTARYHAPARSYSSPRPPTQSGWDARQTYAPPNMATYDDMNPLGMNKL